MWWKVEIDWGMPKAKEQVVSIQYTDPSHFFEVQYFFTNSDSDMGNKFVLIFVLTAQVKRGVLVHHLLMLAKITVNCGQLCK